MARPFSGKVHTGLTRQKQKNGDVYILERTTKYDPEVGYTRNLSYKLIGKIKAGTTEMVPTRPRRSTAEKKDSGAIADSQHVGATDILEWIGHISGIDVDLEESFGKAVAQKVVTIARFWLSNPKSTLARIGKWQRTHPTPCETELTRKAYHDLFEQIGIDVGSTQKYFQLRSRRSGKDDVIAYDSTTVSTCSENLKAARAGYNKDHDGLDTVKLLTLYSLKTRQPVAFTKQPGNLPDVTSIENTLRELSWLHPGGLQIVTDNGYYSETNMAEYVKRHIKFLTLVSTDLVWVKKEIDAHREELQTALSICPWDLSVHGITIPLLKPLRLAHTRSRSGDEKETGVESPCRLYLHVFMNRDNIARDEKRLLTKLMELKQQIEEGIMEFSLRAQNMVDTFFFVFHRGRGGKMKVTINEEAFASERKNFGYFALVSNKSTDAFNALTTYRLREKIEEIFKNEKSNDDGYTPRVWYDDNLNGRLFCQFIALGYWCVYRKLIGDLKRTLKMESQDELEAEKKSRKKLLTWLENKSLTDILDWFDCIELTQLKGTSSKIHLVTEMTARDKFFLKLLKETEALTQSVEKKTEKKEPSAGTPAKVTDPKFSTKDVTSSK